MNKVETEYAKTHIQELLEKRAIVPSSREPGDFCSNVFLCPKPNGKYRMILNFKIFNQFAAKSRFKMETLQSIMNLVTKNSWMTILDLQDAFLTVPCKPEHCAYLKFIFQGKIWKYIHSLAVWLLSKSKNFHQDSACNSI